MKRIGVIGVGAMGRGVVKNLVNEGYEVYVYDTSAHCCSQADDLGAKVEKSPNNVGKNVEMLLASLPMYIRVSSTQAKHPWKLLATLIQER